MSKNALQRESARFWFSRGQWIMKTADASVLSATAFEAGAQWLMRTYGPMITAVQEFGHMAILLVGEDIVSTMAAQARNGTRRSQTERHVAKVLGMRQHKRIRGAASWHAVIADLP